VAAEARRFFLAPIWRVSPVLFGMSLRGVGGPENAPRKVLRNRCRASFVPNWSESLFMADDFEDRTFTTAQPRVIDVGRCIYCVKENTTNLTREHVLPLGFGGGLILLNATCEAHRVITGGIEDILRTTFGAFRHRSNLPSRRRKTRPDHYPLDLDHGTHKETKMVPVNEHPAHLILPQFKEQPGVLRDGEVGPLDVDGFWIFQRRSSSLNSALLKHAKSRDSKITANMNVWDFARMLAKMAHGIAIAEYGFCFEPMLIELIEGDGLPQAGYLIGNASTPVSAIPKGAGDGHGYRTDMWTLSPELQLVVVSLRLFAGQETSPTYDVVTGLIEHPSAMIGQMASTSDK
jgi:hypothetical protein